MKSWTYEQAGVPHLKGDPAYNRKISSLVKSTRIAGVMGSATGFASLFDPKKSGLKDPLIVTSTDGVGTKLEIARLQGKHDTIGIDLVAMCVNDLICCGAKPVIFLDYFATGKFDSGITGEVLKGIVKGCRESDCALVGGETAIMPGFYSVAAIKGAPEYDVAGFAVGLVDRKKVVSGKTINKGDKIIGLASSGFHSNGFSLLRKLFTRKQLQGSVGRQLLTPTKLYVRPVLALLSKLPLQGIVNITGGGFYDNLPRVIPAGLGATIYKKAWKRPKVFEFVASSGNISTFEMFRTFNQGIGMVLVVRPAHADKARALLSRMRVQNWEIGEVRKGHSVEVL